MALLYFSFISLKRFFWFVNQTYTFYIEITRFHELNTCKINTWSRHLRTVKIELRRPLHWNIKFFFSNNHFKNVKIQHLDCILKRVSSNHSLIYVEIKLSAALVAILQHRNAPSNGCLQSKSVYKIDSCFWT